MSEPMPVMNRLRTRRGFMLIVLVVSATTMVTSLVQSQTAGTLHNQEIVTQIMRNEQIRWLAEGFTNNDVSYANYNGVGGASTGISPPLPPYWAMWQAGFTAGPLVGTGPFGAPNYRLTVMTWGGADLTGRFHHNAQVRLYSSTNLALPIVDRTVTRRMSQLPGGPDRGYYEQN